MFERLADGYPSKTAQELEEELEDWDQDADQFGRCASKEILDKFYLLSSTRPQGFDVGAITLSEMKLAKEASWIECTWPQWVSWIRQLDQIWLKDQRDRAKVRRKDAENQQIHDRFKDK